MNYDVKRVLEENRLYDDNFEMVEYNKIDDFFKDYKLNATNITRFQIT